jgi:bifunctional UDP-N-acetylglucosamine pyrophosphorylase/glucosamine-1-phosphate N-acetyltransferase
MTERNLGILILAAGEGKRMKSALPKVLQPVGGKPMIGHVLETAKALNTARMVVVTGVGRDRVEKYLHANYGFAAIAVQEPQNGTGHAVMCAREQFGDFTGDILVLFGDCPLVTADTLKKLINKHQGGALSMIGINANDPRKYGRLVMAKDGGLERIVEFADASKSEKAIAFCNSGVMIANSDKLFAALDQLKNDNARDEYYLTAVVALLRKEGHKIPVIEGNEKEFQGVNSKSELAQAESDLQARLRGAAMDAGATLIDPASVHFSHDTKLGRDVTVWPHVVFAEGVVVEEGATIHSFSHLEGCHVRKGASVGPYARLRPGADIGEGARVGNFVEIKKAKLEQGAKVGHLTYIGDARVGKGANVGAGTITCNYDGHAKHFTDIGDGAFIGSNSALVAPVRIGAGAIIGAGSVITKDVPADALAVSRARQTEKTGGAKTFRKSRKGQS